MLCTGDTQWIHTNPDRAAHEMPGGKTIAHGYHTLALLTGMMGDLLKIQFSQALNYGLDRVRFLSPVPAGARVRLVATLAGATPVDDDGVKLETDCTVEIEGGNRPALVARSISIFYP